MRRCRRARLLGMSLGPSLGLPGFLEAFDGLYGFRVLRTETVEVIMGFVKFRFEFLCLFGESRVLYLDGLDEELRLCGLIVGTR